MHIVIFQSFLFQILVAGTPLFEDAFAKVFRNDTSQCQKPAPSADVSEDGGSLLQVRSVPNPKVYASKYCQDHFNAGPPGDNGKATRASYLQEIPPYPNTVLPVFLGVGIPQTGLEAINTSLHVLGYSENQVTKLNTTLIALVQSFYAASEAHRPAAANAAADGIWEIFLSSPALEPTGGSFNPVIWTGASNGALGLAANLAVNLTLSEPHGESPYFSLEGNTLTGVLAAYLQFLPVLPGQTAAEVLTQTPTNQMGGPVDPFGVINSFDGKGGCQSGNCFDFGNSTFYPITSDSNFFNKVSSLFSEGSRPQCKVHAVIATTPWWFNFIMTDEMPVLSRRCVSFALHNDIPDDLDNASSGQSAQEFVDEFFGYVSPLPKAPIQNTRFDGQSVSVEGAISGRASPMTQCTFYSFVKESITIGLELGNLNDDGSETLATNLDFVDSRSQSENCTATKTKQYIALSS